MTAPIIRTAEHAAEHAAGRVAGPAPGRAVRTAGRVLDAALTVAIRRAAAGPSRLFFTERQLYYELCRVLQPMHHAPARLPFTARPAVGYGRFTSALRRRGPVPGLLPATGEAPRRHSWLGAEHDILDYGLPRLLICQDATIAHMLVANDLHMESVCPIFAKTDLPLDPRLPEALGGFEGAAVYVLHDASLAGLALPGRVRAELALPAEVPVVPLGLLPRHAAALHLTATPAEPAADRRPGHASVATEDLRQDAHGPARKRDINGYRPDAMPGTLSLRERRWLATGRQVEIAAVPPARLLRTLHRLLKGHPRNRRGRIDLRAARAAGFLTWPES